MKHNELLIAAGFQNNYPSANHQSWTRKSDDGLIRYWVNVKLGKGGAVLKMNYYDADQWVGDNFKPSELRQVLTKLGLLNSKRTGSMTLLN
ncbi:hypothetical protein CEW46_32615 [Bacillus cereus]|nr:hypothetical protein CEW46_32615 [Bacillus cereus]